MAKETAANPTPRRTGKKKAPMGMRLTMLLAALPMVYVIYPTLILLGATMAPTLLAYVIDRSRVKYMAVTVGLLNACGSLPAIVRLWQLEQKQSVTFDVLRETSTWFEAYGAAFVGWLVYFGMAPIIHNFYALTTAGRIHGLRRRQRSLIKEWGAEVAEGWDEEFAAEVLAKEQEGEAPNEEAAEANG